MCILSDICKRIVLSSLSMKLIITSLVVSFMNVGAQPENRLRCVMNDNMPDYLCILSISGFEVSYYPINSSKMFYLDYKNCNGLVDKSIFRERPYFVLKFLKPNYFFTIMMINGRNYPQVNENVYLHYLACNIQGEDLGVAEIGNAIELASYIPPRESSRNNTISFLLYQQTNELQLKLMDFTLLSRDNFDPIAWASKQPTVEFCGPIAALQMQVF